MGKQGCLDTGVITLLYAKDTPKEVDLLFNTIKSKKLEAHVVAPILSEAYYHICKKSGKIAAELKIASFLNTYPIRLINFNQGLILKAGELKCKHSGLLSYNDCFAVAHALINKLTFHTTEKGLKKILPQLKTELYYFK